MDSPGKILPPREFCLRGNQEETLSLKTRVSVNCVSIYNFLRDSIWCHFEVKSFCFKIKSYICIFEVSGKIQKLMSGTCLPTWTVHNQKALTSTGRLASCLRGVSAAPAGGARRAPHGGWMNWSCPLSPGLLWSVVLLSRIKGSTVSLSFSYF